MIPTNSSFFPNQTYWTETLIGRCYFLFYSIEFLFLFLLFPPPLKIPICIPLYTHTSNQNSPTEKRKAWNPEGLDSLVQGTFSRGVHPLRCQTHCSRAPGDGGWPLRAGGRCSARYVGGRPPSDRADTPPRQTAGEPSSPPPPPPSGTNKEMKGLHHKTMRDVAKCSDNFWC